MHNKKNVNHKAIYMFHETRFLDRFGFDMLVSIFKQVNLEYILQRTKQNLKHETQIQTKNSYTLTEPNHA